MKFCEWSIVSFLFSLLFSTFAENCLFLHILVFFFLVVFLLADFVSAVMGHGTMQFD